MPHSVTLSPTSFDVEMSPFQMGLIHRALKIALGANMAAGPVPRFTPEEVEELEALAAMSEIGAPNGPELGVLNGWSL